jgi:transposase
MSLDFREVFSSGDSRQLRYWIEAVKRSEIGPIIRFAWGLTKDLSAVTAAVDTKWSSGQSKVKLTGLKLSSARCMVGRASRF